jgi:hypothetical protein
MLGEEKLRETENGMGLLCYLWHCDGVFGVLELAVNQDMFCAIDTAPSGPELHGMTGTSVASISYVLPRVLDAAKWLYSSYPRVVSAVFLTADSCSATTAR